MPKYLHISEKSIIFASEIIKKTNLEPAATDKRHKIMKTTKKYISDPVERTKKYITMICEENESADITIEMDNYCNYYYLHGTPGFSHKFAGNILFIDTPRGRNMIDMSHVFNVTF